MYKGKVLIVDDNEDVLFSLNMLLKPHTEAIRVATNPDKIEHFMKLFEPDVVLLDMNFKRDAVSGQEGFKYLEKILSIDRDTVVIFMTAYSDTEKAVRAIKAGATDFISKPWDNEKLLSTLQAAMELRYSRMEVLCLKEKLAVLGGGDDGSMFIGESPEILKIKANIERFAQSDANILILGENGTGKDVVARLIHKYSRRRENPFVAIDLGSVPEQLFESELFGYEKGAFTGAVAPKAGRMEVASGGTLFLDEIGNLSLQTQAKLLTAIEKREIVRVGGTKSKHIDVRFISSDMIGGDRLVELAAGKEIKKLLDMDMIAAMAGPYMAGGEPKNPHDGRKHVRSSQLNAFIGVDRKMNVIFSHYFRSLTDFPSVKAIVKAMKNS